MSLIAPIRHVIQKGRSMYDRVATAGTSTNPASPATASTASAPSSALPLPVTPAQQTRQNTHQGGFEAFHNSQVNQSGNLGGVPGKGSVFLSGPYKGLSLAQARERSEQAWLSMGDAEKEQWASHAMSLRAPSEGGQLGSAGTSPLGSSTAAAKVGMGSIGSQTAAAKAAMGSLPPRSAPRSPLPMPDPAASTPQGQALIAQAATNQKNGIVSSSDKGSINYANGAGISAQPDGSKILATPKGGGTAKTMSDGEFALRPPAVFTDPVTGNKGSLAQVTGKPSALPSPENFAAVQQGSTTKSGQSITAIDPATGKSSPVISSALTPPPPALETKPLPKGKSTVAANN